MGEADIGEADMGVARRRTVGLLLVMTVAASAAVLGATSPALASFGEMSDANDGGTIDIRRVTHDDTPAEIVYTLEAYDAIPVNGNNEAMWSLSTAASEYGDATVRMSTNAGAPTAEFQCGAGAPVGAALTFGPTGSATSTAENSFEVRFPRDRLEACGVVAATYRYVVHSDNNDEIGVVEDVVPESFLGGPGITHTLSDEVQRYVEKAYLDLLGRPADAGGRDYWSGIVRTEGRQAFTRGLVFSPTCEWPRRVVNELYDDSLGRPADPGGLEYWSGRICGGDPVRLVASLIYGSTEYFNDPAQGGGTPEGYVRSLYNDILGRDPSAEDVAFWVGEFQRRGAFAVATDIYQSLESRERRVRRQYVALLRRQPDRGGLDFWAGRLAFVDDLVLTVDLTASEEYYLAPRPG